MGSDLLILADSAAAANSNLGMVICFSGATRDFPAMKEQWALFP